MQFLGTSGSSLQQRQQQQQWLDHWGAVWSTHILPATLSPHPASTPLDLPPCSGPREDATRIGSAGVVRRQAVDVSPLRRVNQAIWLITTGARESAFRNIKTIAECLADELINAAKGSSNRCGAVATCAMAWHAAPDVRLWTRGSPALLRTLGSFLPL